MATTQEKNNVVDDCRLYRKEQVVGIINSVLCRVKSPVDVSREELVNQLTELRNVTEDLQAQLSAVNAGDISSTYIPNAANELDAVISSTEEATNTIMKACEEIMVAGKNADPALQRTIESCVIRVFEGCTFQDITGQRIKKVTDNLKQIETKIGSIMKTLQDRLVDLENTKGSGTKENQEQTLLSGPALPQQAVSQNDIDALLAEFDTPHSNGG